MYSDIFLKSLLECGLTSNQIEAICDLHDVLYEGLFDSLKDKYHRLKNGYDELARNGNGTIRAVGKGLGMAALGTLGVHGMHAVGHQLGIEDRCNQPAEVEYSTDNAYPDGGVIDVDNPVYDIGDYGLDAKSYDNDALIMDNSVSNEDDDYSSDSSNTVSVINGMTNFILKNATKKARLTENDAKRYAEWILKYSDEFNVDKYYAIALFTTESHFDKDTVSKDNAIGLGQLVPTSGGLDAARLLKMGDNYNEAILFDPETNIKMAIRYFKWCSERPITNGNIDYIVAKYNGGDNRVRDLSDFLSGKITYDEAYKRSNKKFEETFRNYNNFNINYANAKQAF